MVKAMHVVKGQGHIDGSATNWFTFRFTWVSPAIPVIQLFKKLTLKIQGQGHDQGQN